MAALKAINLILISLIGLGAAANFLCGNFLLGAVMLTAMPVVGFEVDGDE